jgi:glycosyltransferase involved in cell wall biosynthesis
MRKNIWIINHYAIPPSMGGLVRHTYFSRYLSEKGYNVRIFTASKIHNADVNMIEDGSLYKEIEIDGTIYTFIRTGDYSKNGISRIKNMLQFPSNAGKAFKHFDKPDIIYTSSPDIFTAYKAIKTAKKLNVPCITEIRDLWPESIVEYNRISRDNPVIKALFMLERRIYKNSDRLIFTMEGGRDYIAEKGWEKDVDINKIYNINNGIDLEEFRRNREKYIVFDEDLNNNGKFKIIYTGSVRKVNNLNAVLDASKYLTDENCGKIVFIIYGDGNEKDILMKRCEEEGIKNVYFKGRVEKKYIPYILSQADANLYHWKQTPLMRFGSSGNKLFDYLASGRPILSTIHSNYDIIEKYNAGVVSKDQSPAQIAKAAIKLYKASFEENNSMRKNALRLAEEYDYKKLTDKLTDIIENIQ